MDAGDIELKESLNTITNLKHEQHTINSSVIVSLGRAVQPKSKSNLPFFSSFLQNKLQILTILPVGEHTQVRTFTNNNSYFFVNAHILKVQC